MNLTYLQAMYGILGFEEFHADPLHVVEHDFDIIKYLVINLSKFVGNMQLLS